MSNDFSDMSDEYLAKECKRLRELAKEAELNAEAIMGELLFRYRKRHDEERASS